MADVLSILAFVLMMVLFLSLAFRVGIFDICLARRDFAVSDSCDEIGEEPVEDVSAPQEVMFQRTHFLFGCQGMRQRRRLSAYGLD